MHDAKIRSDFQSESFRPVIQGLLEFSVKGWLWEEGAVELSSSHVGGLATLGGYQKQADTLSSSRWRLDAYTPAHRKLDRRCFDTTLSRSVEKSDKNTILQNMLTEKTVKYYWASI